jgi:hypothetical protein
VDDERRSLKSWAQRLSIADEPLTREDATLLALISCNDRLVEIQAAIEDLSNRYQLLDRFMADRFKDDGYRAPQHLKALAEGER